MSQSIFSIRSRRVFTIESNTCAVARCACVVRAPRPAARRFAVRPSASGFPSSARKHDVARALQPVRLPRAAYRASDADVRISSLKHLFRRPRARVAPADFSAFSRHCFAALDDRGGHATVIAIHS
ncbi:hypothetical protein Bmul_3770 [Burkholderia multivorans ATCC 17616]|nr:hypothetical protein Bmul_3770 [Burkholderia multivorans ATCC 17616]